MKLGIASDHAGYDLKTHLIAFGKQKFNIELYDFGPDSKDPIDYPLQAKKIAQAMQKKQVTAGILICGSGVGISIAANRYPFIRAALCYGVEIAKLARRHNDANILVFGARFIQAELAEACFEAFLTTAFEGGRHQRRVDQLSKMGALKSE